jgi:hypothetical protein
MEPTPTVTWEMTRDEASQFNAIVEHCLKTINQSNERSAQRLAEIDSLQAETRVLLNQIRQALNVETNF